MKKLVVFLIAVIVVAMSSSAKQVKKREVYECTQAYSQSTNNYQLDPMPNVQGTRQIIIYYTDGTISRDGKAFFRKAKETDAGAVTYKWVSGGAPIDKSRTITINPYTEEMQDYSVMEIGNLKMSFIWYYQKR